MKKTAQQYDLEAGYSPERYYYDAFCAAVNARDVMQDAGLIKSKAEQQILDDFIHLMRLKTNG